MLNPLIVLGEIGIGEIGLLLQQPLEALQILLMLLPLPAGFRKS